MFSSFYHKCFLYRLCDPMLNDITIRVFKKNRVFVYSWDIYILSEYANMLILSNKNEVFINHQTFKKLKRIIEYINLDMELLGIINKYNFQQN